MSKKLDGKNIELSKILFEMKQNLDIYKAIGLNAKSINLKGSGKTFFGIAQRNALRLYIVDVCKIFEERKNNKLNSLPEIIDFIKNNQIELIDFKPICKFVQSNDKSTTREDDYLEILSEILGEFKEKNKNIFKFYKTLRDKKLVHAEDISRLQKNSSPTFCEMERLLLFGVAFYSMIHKAFIGGCPFE